MNKLKRLFNLFWIFFKIGSFTFGGGLAMLPLIQNEVVDKRKWVSEEEIVDIFAVSQSVPGVISINSSIFVGSKVAGLFGAVAAALGIILPAFISILFVFLLLSWLKGKSQTSVVIDRFFAGIRAASAALILLTTIKLGKSAIKGKPGLVIALVSFTSIIVFNIHAAWAVVFGGAAGYIMYLYNRRKA